MLGKGVAKGKNKNFYNLIGKNTLIKKLSLMVRK